MNDYNHATSNETFAQHVTSIISNPRHVSWTLACCMVTEAKRARAAEKDLAADVASLGRELDRQTDQYLAKYDVQFARAEAAEKKLATAKEALRKIAEAHPDAPPTMEWAIASDAMEALK